MTFYENNGAKVSATFSLLILEVRFVHQFWIKDTVYLFIRKLEVRFVDQLNFEYKFLYRFLLENYYFSLYFLITVQNRHIKAINI